MPSAKSPIRKSSRSAPALDRTALVVAGMHRSGTSALARVLSLAGARLPEHVIDPGPDNPLGFWEPVEMVDLNDRILASVGSRWDDVFGHRVGAAVWEARENFAAQARGFIKAACGPSELVVLKDPRASLMMRFWDEALVAEGLRPVHLVMVRHPLEVAASIARRGGGSTPASVLAWAAYMLAVERDTRGGARTFIDYGELISDWRTTLARVEGVAGRSLFRLDDARSAQIDAFLSEAHRHHRLHGDALRDAPDLWVGVAPVWDWMSAAASGAEPPPEPLEAAMADLEAVAAVAAPALSDLRAEVETLPSLRADLAEATRDNQALRELANRFHAEADHNGRHWEAERGQTEYLRREWHLALAQAEGARAEAARILPIRNEIALAEARNLRLQAQTREVSEALEKERRQAASVAQHHLAVIDAQAARIAQLESEIAAGGSSPPAEDANPKTVGSSALPRPLRVVAKRLRGLARPSGK